eukprot:TRINITY_DN15165_c0_g3_i3.p1 TRINITY_DN15165_c0_g3~~TRINITY_DN15165_c0_g3_i3.p1  ORF type:complete len:527 (+),score=54.79 TRINITY_DN15165_c0_g3_i3:29-1609(+)
MRGIRLKSSVAKGSPSAEPLSLSRTKTKWDAMFVQSKNTRNKVKSELESHKFNYIRSKHCQNLMTVQLQKRSNSSLLKESQSHKYSTAMNVHKWVVKKTSHNSVRLHAKVRKNAKTSSPLKELNEHKNCYTPFDCRWQLREVKTAMSRTAYNRHSHKYSAHELLKQIKLNTTELFLKDLMDINSAFPSRTAPANKQTTPQLTLYSEYQGKRLYRKRHSRVACTQGSAIVAKPQYAELLRKHYGFDLERDGNAVKELLRAELDSFVLTVLKKEVQAYRKEDTGTLNKEELRLIKQQILDHAAISMNCMKQILTKISFFETIEQLQIDLLRISYYKSFAKGEAIAEIENVYIILNGEVAVYSNSKIVRKLHNGELFDVRLAECEQGTLKLVARCGTSLLIIAREELEEVIYKYEENELYSRLYAVKSCSLFAEVPLSDLFVFALKLKTVIKKFGEIVVKKGDIQTKCYIIAAGTCKSYIEHPIESKATSKSYLNEIHVVNTSHYFPYSFTRRNSSIHQTKYTREQVSL